MFTVLILLCFSSIAFGQLQQNGSCNFSGFQTVTNIANLRGTWYQYKRIQDQNDVGQCSSLEVDVSTNGTVQFKSKSVNNRLVLTRNARVSPSVANIFNIKYDDGVDYIFAVVNTDNSNYCVLYGCRNLNNNNRYVYGQVYVKSLTVSSNTLNAIESAINYNAFNGTTWQSVLHTKEACRADGGVNLHLSSPILLIVGLILFKNI